MGLFIFILFLLGLAYLFWPIIRVWLAYRTASRQAQDYFSGRNSGRSTSAGQRTQTQHPRKKHKIIDPSVGEYVEFEEVRTYQSETEISDSQHTVKYETEEQIVDVEWEDIK